MQLCLYNLSQTEAHHRCKAAIVACGLSIEQDDSIKGFLSATLVSEHPLPVACLTTRVLEQPYGVTVSIVSSYLSVRFGNFWHNPEGEEQFVDELLSSLRQQKAGPELIMVPWSVEEELIAVTGTSPSRFPSNTAILVRN